MDLSTLDLMVGQPLGEQLKTGDVVFEIDNKSLTNRPDLWGHYGLAREVAVIYGLKLKELNCGNVTMHKEALKVCDQANQAVGRLHYAAYRGVAPVEVAPQVVIERKDLLEYFEKSL